MDEHLGIRFNIHLLNTKRRKAFQIDFQEHPELGAPSERKAIIRRVKKLLRVPHGVFVYPLGIVFHTKSVAKRAAQARAVCEKWLDDDSNEPERTRWRCAEYLNQILELKCPVGDFLQSRGGFRVMCFVVKDQRASMFMAQMCSGEAQKEELLLQLYRWKTLVRDVSADALRMISMKRDGAFESVLISHAA